MNCRHKKSIIMDDNHERCARILLEHIPKSALLQQPTVIHVGAHKGEEVPIYKEFGFGTIHLVEANPELSQYLVKKFNLETNINVENFAISNHGESVDFIIHTTESGSLESSSMLKLKQLGEIVPVFDSSKVIKVKSCTLDGFYQRHFCVAERIGLLVLDIQGAELLALQGAMSMLEYTDAIICEVNLIETYEGCALEEEISNFLEKQGFYNSITIYHELYNGDKRFPAWGEGLWMKLRS